MKRRIHDFFVRAALITIPAGLFVGLAGCTTYGVVGVFL